jgi:hypothetical protein
MERAIRLGAEPLRIALRLAHGIAPALLPLGHDAALFIDLNTLAFVTGMRAAMWLRVRGKAAPICGL